MTREDYMVALLERIAFQTFGGNLDFKDYLEQVVIEHAIARGYEVSSDTQRRQEDQAGVRKGHKPGHRG